ncbi:MAG: glycosyltransferase family 39 protein [Ardenticatenales bacterium]|nr:glycosyltransferase family 39 protein [Ardenticatenales bacterium]
MLQGKRLLLLCLSALALFGMVTLAVATRRGIGLSADSVAYINGARHFLDGYGLRLSPDPGPENLMIIQAPLYPLLLSALAFSGIDILVVARWFNILLFGLNIVLIGLLIYRHTRGIYVSLLGSWLALTSVTVIRMHGEAATEALFISLTLSGLFFLALHLERPSKPFLIGAAIAIGLAAITRYVGVVLIATAVLGILVHRRSWHQRARDSAIFVAISSLPPGIWFVRNFLLAGSATAREMGYHPMTVRNVQQAIYTVGGWLLPLFVPKVLGMILGIATLYLLFITLTYGLRKNAFVSLRKTLFAQPFPSLLAIFVLLYIPFLLITRFFVDAETLLNDRILLPAQMAVLIGGLSSIPSILRQTEGRYSIPFTAIALAIVLSVSHLLNGAAWVMESYQEGLGFASATWQESEAIAHVKQLPRDTLIISNGADIIYILTGKTAYFSPQEIEPTALIVNEAYAADLERLKAQAAERQVVVVYLDNVDWRWYLASEEELREDLPLQPLFEAKDGTIYRVIP